MRLDAIHANDVYQFKRDADLYVNLNPIDPRSNVPIYWSAQELNALADAIELNLCAIPVFFQRTR